MIIQGNFNKETDPVLQRLKKQLDPEWFFIYKKTIEHYFQEMFLYQLENNKQMYEVDDD
jgi:hypothetical protein